MHLIIELKYIEYIRHYLVIIGCLQAGIFPFWSAAIYRRFSTVTSAVSDCCRADLLQKDSVQLNIISYY
jgi:hypothetical protein